MTSNLTWVNCSRGWLPTPSGNCISAVQSLPATDSFLRDAEAECTRFGAGAHLPVLLDQLQVMEFIVASGLVTKDWGSTLLGLKRRLPLANRSAWKDNDGSGAEWTWVDGTSVNFTLWASGEPNNNGGSELAVCLGAGSGENPVWYDAWPGRCGTHFFCQITNQQQAPPDAERALGHLKDLVMSAWHGQAAAPTRCHVEVPRPKGPTRRMPPPRCNGTRLPDRTVTQNCMADGVIVAMTVDGVDYAQLSNDVGLVAAFKQQVQEKVAAAAGPPIRPEHVSVTLSPGSVLITAIVTPPRGTSADAVQSAIENDEDMPVVMALALGAVDGMSRVMTGPTITVGSLSVRAAKLGTAASGRKPHSLVAASTRLPVASVMVALVTSMVALALMEETAW